MTSTGKEAVVLGATGLVGRAAVVQLLADPSVSRVTTIVRRASEVRDPRLVERVVDFEHTESWAPWVRGELLFSALGTTIKAAGSQAAQYRVDHDYQLRAAEAARQNGIETCVLVSAQSSNPKSPVFYSRMKGELEERVRALEFPRLRILRPGLLDGEREEKRGGEKFALSLLRHVPTWPSLANLRPIRVEDVARAGLLAAADPRPGTWIIAPRELFELVGK